MSDNKNNEIGAIWVKQGQHGEYLSITVELDGKKHNLTAFKSRYKQEGDKKPTYYIPAPRSQNEGGTKADDMQSRIDFVNAEKAKRAQERANDPGMAFNQEPNLNETDIPF